LVHLGRIDEARSTVQALLEIRPAVTVGRLRQLLDYLPGLEDWPDCLRMAGLPD
jgi:hypothetical protein